MNRRHTRGAQSKPFISGGTIYAQQNVQAPAPPSFSKVSEPASQVSASPNILITPAKPTQATTVSAPPQQADKKPVEQQVALPTMSNQMEIKDFANDSEDTGDQPGVKGFFRKMFKNRKKPSVRAKEKKIRQNRLIRRVLIPKNALMALHEVKNIKIDDFHITSNPGGGFQAIVTVNNVQYQGVGCSKNAAKSNVCEKALRDLVIAKMSVKSSRSSSMENLSNNDVEMKDVNEVEEEEDDVPILNLASFALFKLFSEWEAEGYDIPEFRPTHPNGNQCDPAAIEKQEKPKKQPPIRNELPVGWETMHPATLLCVMRPGLTYIDLGAEGLPPNQTQKTGVTVDDQHFIGTGKSKKIARKNAAANACNTLFNTNFPSFVN
ncbi:uncharacterized protein LOC129619173 isoform X2 [Condylostylus longicornis]|uniref:uncharacterized protein LOC129619173 isoform X2 n=1 Tax=Condylostylus longicornis TaxID=2530218 RepID=UPI00244E0629|nr:uncharacterized protein LOC129619173 isoform X2 [Condylostylus longicornis]